MRPHGAVLKNLIERLFGQTPANGTDIVGQARRLKTPTLPQASFERRLEGSAVREAGEPIQIVLLSRVEERAKGLHTPRHGQIPHAHFAHGPVQIAKKAIKEILSKPRRPAAFRFQPVEQKREVENLQFEAPLDGVWSPQDPVEVGLA